MGIESEEGFGEARLGMRACFSGYFLWAAEHMSSLAGQIEASHSGEPRFDPEHRAYVLSAVISSVSFLEAAINEIYKDACDRRDAPSAHEYLAPLGERAIDALSATWEGTDEGKKLQVLEKWQLLLIFCGRKPLDEGARPFQDVKLVVALRNVLVHFKPELAWADDELKREAQLRGKFDLNRLMIGAGNPWWPDHCLGHGCAAWAVDSVRRLADDVSAQLGLTLHYRQAEDGLGREPGTVSGTIMSEPEEPS